MGTAALFLTGLAVRLLDDALDVEEDRAAGVPNLARRLGPATPAYAALCLALASLLLPAVAPAVVLAAYGVGMAGNLSERLPTRLPAWAETVAVLALLALLVPPAAAAWSLCLMGALQAADRFLEGRRARGSPMPPPEGSALPPPGAVPPAARRLAPGVLALGLALVAAGLAPGLTLAGLAAAAALELLFKVGRRGGQAGA